MKNAKNFLLLVCALFFASLIGFFIGRNHRTDYVKLKTNNTVISESLPETTQNYRLDINTATKNQLMELPGIGEVIAQRIVDYRSINGAFNIIDELLEIEGIGNAKLQQIDELICIGG